MNKPSYEELLSALEALSAMYSHAWDKVGGGLMMMDRSVTMFDDAHDLAHGLINRAKGLPPPYSDTEYEPEWEWANTSSLNRMRDTLVLIAAGGLGVRRMQQEARAAIDDALHGQGQPSSIADDGGPSGGKTSW